MHDVNGVFSIETDTSELWRGCCEEKFKPALPNQAAWGHTNIIGQFVE